VIAGILSGQAPVIYPGGVVNGASFAASSSPGGWLAPGSIASIFGENLAPVTQQQTVPLPFQAAGVQVTFNGTPAALFYVSPNQLNVQVPSSLIPYGAASEISVNVVVTTPSGSSAPVAVTVASSATGIFTLNASGCGQGAILNDLPDGSVQIHGPNASVQAGDWISVYFTGLGRVGNQPPDGQPSSYTPLYDSGPGTFVIGPLDAPVFGVYGTSGYWGKAPGLVGVDQVNGQIPQGAPEGCQIPLRLGGSATYSQPVPLSIHTGRGACVPQPISLGAFEWRKIYPNNAPPSEQLYVRLSASEGAAFPPLLQAASGGYALLAAYAPAPQCANLLPTSLDAGTEIIQVPGGQLDLPTPLPPGGETTFALPVGTVGAGTHNVTAMGGKDVGPFSTTVTMPQPIQITSQFPTGATIPCASPITVSWTGADDNSIVVIKLIAPNLLISSPYLETVVPGSAGTFTFVPMQTGGLPSMTLPFFPACNIPVEIDVTQMPAASATTTFSASGLTLGGRNTWKYEFQFQGLQLVGPEGSLRKPE
jgi:uncharacterized protein (TIGR03437 family)